MGIGAAIAGGVSAVAGLAGSALSSGAASSAADQQAQAANQAAELTHQQYLQTAANLKPFLDTGSAAFQRLGQIYGLGSGPAASSGAAPAASGGGVPAAPFTLPSSPSGSGYQIVPSTSWVPQGGEGGTTQQAQTFNVFDAQGNLVNTFDDSTPLWQIQAAYPGTPAGPANGGGGGGGGGGAQPATSADALSAYGLSGLTYNPADYGLGNGVFNPTQATLEATPGYQFTLSQGLKSVQNSAAAKGQGVSGAALKGAANYATGLADNTLNTQANIFNSNVARTQGVFQQNLGNVINPLLSYAQLGENAGAQTGAVGAQAVNAQSNLLTGAANAQAAGTVGSANALASGLSGAGQSPLNYLLYNNLLSGGGGSASSNGWNTLPATSSPTQPYSNTNY